MYYYLEGKVILVKNNFLVLLNNGIGYKIFVGNYTLQVKEGNKIFLWIYHSVKENSIELYGFEKLINLEIFELLISISGIGPKVALSILDLTTPESLKKAVLTEEITELTKVSGIGPKVAKKIILELKNKIEKIDIEVNQEETFDLETFETLEALGFAKNQIREVMQELKNYQGKDKIKEALKILGKK